MSVLACAWLAVCGHLVELVPDGVEVLLDGVAPVGDARHLHLDVRVTLPLHHAAHEVVLGDQVLGLGQVDAQHALGTQGVSGTWV